MTKNSKVSDEIMAAAAAESDPKALSAAHETKPAVDGSAFDHDGDGKVGGSKPKVKDMGAHAAAVFDQPKPTDDDPLEYRVKSLEKRVKDMEKLIMGWQAIYAWPLPWQTTPNAREAADEGNPRPAEESN